MRFEVTNRTEQNCSRTHVFTNRLPVHSHRTEQNRTRTRTCSRTPRTARWGGKNGRDVDSLDISYTKVRHHKENISVDLRDVSTPVLAFFCVKNQHILEAVLGHFTSLCATVRSERTRTNCSRTRVFANEVPCRRRKSEQNRTEHEQRTVREQCSRTRTEHRPLRANTSANAVPQEAV